MLWRRLAAVGLCEGAIFAAGCWVGIMYPNAPHWVWLVVVVVCLIAAYIIWPRDAQVVSESHKERSEAPLTSGEFWDDIFPKKERRDFGRIMGPLYQLIGFAVVAAILVTLFKYMQRIW